MDNKIISIADVTSIRELNQSVDKAYDLYCADNKTLFMNWLKSRNWQPFDSMDFDIGAKSFMNIKAKIINNVTITRPKEGAKDKRITGSTKKGFMPDGKIYNTKGKTEDEIYEKVTKEYIKRRKQLKHKPT